MPIEQNETGLDAGNSQESRRRQEEARSTPLVTPPQRPRPTPPTGRSVDRGPAETGQVEPVARVTVAMDERDSDVLLDIPRLQVDELGLDLEATALLRHVRLDVKDLQLGLLLRADLEHLAELAGGHGDGGSRGRRAGGRLATAAYGRLFGGDRDRERAQLEAGPDAEEAGPAEAETTGRSEGDGPDRPAASRFTRAAKEGGKAAAVAAAGLAGGALVESRLHPLRKHGVDLPAPLRRRESAPRAALRRLTRALPG